MSQEATPAGGRGTGSSPQAAEKALEHRAADAQDIVDFTDTTLGADEENGTGELTNLDQHPADTSDITYQRELNLTQRMMAEDRLADVAAAEERLREGTYGVCTNCGQPIDPERLRARPEAALCIRCQRQQDEGHL
jgi:DnaK suppressor protein